MRYKHLVIIGNGFDRDCGLQTSLSSYEAYFGKKYERVMVEEGIDSIDGRSPFHVTYGQALISQQRNFWSAYEENLGRPDFKSLRLMKVKEQERCLVDTKKLSDVVFRNWISETYESGRNRCRQGNVNPEAYFLNFNYTPTLQELFGADDKQVHHLHGRLREGQRIIVGHNAGGRVRPRPEWYGDSEIGKRCYIEDTYLYDTDKKSNWIKLRMTRNNVGNLSPSNAGRANWSKFELSTQAIRQIIVLGHSLNPIDLTYFNYIHRKTKENNPVWFVSWYEEKDLYNAYHLKALLRIPDYLFIVDKLPVAASRVMKFESSGIV